MFGRIVSELVGAATIAIERRSVAVNYDEAMHDDDMHPEGSEEHEQLRDTFRVTADLCDCDLGSILNDVAQELDHDAATQALVIAKHLCSNATDLAISCVSDQCKRESDHHCVDSMVLAPCCHPQISWSGYSNTGGNPTSTFCCLNCLSHCGSLSL